MGAAPTVQDAIHANPPDGWVVKDVLNGHVQPFGVCLAVQLTVDGIRRGRFCSAHLPACGHWRLPAVMPRPVPEGTCVDAVTTRGSNLLKALPLRAVLLHQRNSLLGTATGLDQTPEDIAVDVVGAGAWLAGWDSR